MAQQTQTSPQPLTDAALAQVTGGYHWNYPTTLDTIEAQWLAYRTALLDRVFGRASP